MFFSQNDFILINYLLQFSYIYFRFNLTSSFRTKSFIYTVISYTEFFFLKALKIITKSVCEFAIFFLANSTFFEKIIELFWNGSHTTVICHIQVLNKPTFCFINLSNRIFVYMYILYILKHTYALSEANIWVLTKIFPHLMSLNSNTVRNPQLSLPFLTPFLYVFFIITFALY